jgi:C-terminal processing protease CtpA/Prc
MLANVYKCYQLGTIVGEETGGAPSAYGDNIIFQLPNTKLYAHTSHKKYLDVCDDGKVNGVIPDIEVNPTIEDIRLGRDAAIEYIQQLTK